MISLEEIKQRLQAVSDRISFDPETHTYLVDGVEYKSVSHYQNKYQRKFDPSIATYTAQSYNRIIRRYKNGEATQKDLDKIKEKDIDINVHYSGRLLNLIWSQKNKLAVDIGHACHEYAESYPALPETEDKRKLQIKNWFESEVESKNYEIVGFEIPLFSDSYKYTGTLDLVLYNVQTGKLAIRDYKTNLCTHDEFEGKYYHNLLGSLSHLRNTKVNYYSIQQSLYAQLLEECTGVEVETVKLIHITEDSWKEYDVVDLKEPLLKNLEEKVRYGRFHQAEMKERKLCKKLLEELYAVNVYFTESGSRKCYDGICEIDQKKVLFEIKVHSKSTLTTTTQNIIEKKKYKCLLEKATESEVDEIYYINFFKKDEYQICKLSQEEYNSITWFKKRMKKTTAVDSGFEIKEIAHLKC